MTSLVELLPVLGLRVCAGPLELRGITDDHLPALAGLARDIHPPDKMPFYVPWSSLPAGELESGLARYHWQVRGGFKPESWNLQLGVWWQGELVGVQGFETTDYLVTRSGETGSWMSRVYQGRGIGTAMRQAVCALVFDHLDGEQVTSGAFTDNPASLAVSRKVGYRDNGIRRIARGGQVAEVMMLVLRHEDLVPGPQLDVQGLPAFRRSIGLDAEPGGT